MSSPNSNLFFATSLCCVAATATAAVFVLRNCQKNNQRQPPNRFRVDTRNGVNLTAYEQLILNGTPIIKLQQLSKLLQRQIYVKMESLNPGGTGKDRAALSMIRNAENKGLLPPPVVLDDATDADDNKQHELHLYEEAKEGADEEAIIRNHKMIMDAIQLSKSGGIVVEGTSGSTGIALATLCAARGHACLVVLPDDQAKEKQQILRALGALVHVVSTAAISNPNHYVNMARKLAKIAREEYACRAVFMDQFENEANYDVHYQMTGPEIYDQVNGQIDAFVMSSGTGGTISGVGTYLKEQNLDVEIVLVDPPGSALYNKIEYGVAYAQEQQERSIRKHRYDTIAEGIGLDRVTHNFDLGLDVIDSAIRVSDQEAIDMANWILRVEGLWIGSSSSMNIVGAIRTARNLPKDSKVVTMICDGGHRHATRFWNPTFVQDWGLHWPAENNIPDCLEGVL